MSTRYSGACHCGALAYTYDTALSPAGWSIRACQCTFCLAHGALSTSDPGGSIDFSKTNANLLERYRFGLQTADFLLCHKCGVYVGACIVTERGAFGIINTRTLLDKPADLADVAPIGYDEEDAGGRVSRREERWTPVSRLP
jgi:hypothetical protein